jgi:CpeT/CpcT family (DUF1001)
MTLDRLQTFIVLGFSLIPLAVEWNNPILTPTRAAESHAMPLDRQIGEIADFLIGTMDTSAQALHHRNSPDVRLTTCRIRVENTPNDRLFLYQEQALSLNLSQPYRQRFLQITASEDGERVESIAFKPPNPQAWIGLCDRTDSVVPQAELGEAVCRVFLKPDGDGYLGNTPESGCPTNYRGAVRITNTVILRKDSMETWDRGFDAEGKQVWGAREQSYQYRDIDPQIQDPEVNAIAQWLNGTFATQGEDAPRGYRNCPAIVQNSLFPDFAPALFVERIESGVSRRQLAWVRRTEAAVEVSLYDVSPDSISETDGRNICDRPISERQLEQTSLGERDCTIVFQRQGDAFVGLGSQCIRGAIATETGAVEVRVSKEKLEIWQQSRERIDNPVGEERNQGWVYYPSAL